MFIIHRNSNISSFWMFEGVINVIVPRHSGSVNELVTVSL